MYSHCNITLRRCSINTYRQITFAILFFDHCSLQDAAIRPEAPMSDENERSVPPLPMRGEDDVAADLVRLLPRDLVFTMRFLGESRHLLQRHFQVFMEREMQAAGLTQETYPMIHAFIERHALLMRDFVFSGVALSRQLRIEEIERLMGDRTSLLRVDIWDQLKSHIDMAETQFKSQLPGLPGQLSGWKLPEAPPPGNDR